MMNLENSEKVWSYLEELLKEKKPRDLASDIKRLSDFYIENPSEATPWSESWAKSAYLAYYLPLNFLRAKKSVQRSLQSLRLLSLKLRFQQIIDFGSGLGSGSLPFLLSDCSVTTHNTQYLFVEQSKAAVQNHQNILRAFLDLDADRSKNHKWIQTLPQRFQPEPESLGIFSYSLTELKQLPSWTNELSALLIMEPSTSADARKLMTLREELITAGWYVIAPCTHQNACPLLHQSKYDWCHDRVLVDSSAWFKEIESHLPFKNNSITFSYLFALRLNNLGQNTKSLIENFARLVGDSVPEKGKTRQLICRGPEREFLTWMNRDGEFPALPRGDLIEWPQESEKKSNEIRLKKNPKLVT